MPSLVEWTVCPNPDCTADAEVLDRWTQDSTCGPVSCASTLCMFGHRYYGVADEPAGA